MKVLVVSSAIPGIRGSPACAAREDNTRQLDAAMAVPKTFPWMIIVEDVANRFTLVMLFDH